MKKYILPLFLCLAAVLCFFVLPTQANAATSGNYTYSVYNGEATITDCSESISGNITIPSTLGGYPVVSIDNYAFSYCKKLTGVTIPSSIARIDGDAFCGCESLVSVTIPGSVTRIGDYAFDRCYKLTNVTIQSGVKEIGTRAFSNCAMTDITIPASVTSIGQQAFHYSKLANVYYGGTAEQWAKIKINSDNSYFSNAKVYSAVTIDSSRYPESTHNYAKNSNESKTFSLPQAKKLTVTFNSSTFVENNYDYIYLYNASGTQIAKYTGSTAANKTVDIPGNTFTVKLTSDSSQQYYGYAFSSIVAYTPMHTSHPLCGKSCACSSSSHSSITWTPWDGTTTLYNGNYYLTQDVVLDSTVILNYNYNTYLCLNGYSITCTDTVFYIYSNRVLTITDCVGTGKIETTGAESTIRNNRYLCVWGGNIINSHDTSSQAIEAFSGTSTYVRGGNVTGVNYEAIMAWGGCNIYIYGGNVTSTNRYAIYLDVGSKVNIHGGTVHGKYGATEGLGGSGTPSQLTISGGRVTSDYSYGYALDVGSGDLTMTGGYVEGMSAWNEGTTTISGGTIAGSTYLDSGTVTINAGTFSGTWTLSSTNATVTGGDFSGCDYINMAGKTWICGGTFSTIIEEKANLYLSGVPTVKELQVKYPGTVSAQSIDGTGSFGGSTVSVLLDKTATTWKNGDIVIKNVTSDAVAGKFTLSEEDSQTVYLQRSGNNLVLRILPHGTWGDNVTWKIVDGTLIVSGTGAITSAWSGHDYPWGDYLNQITAIVVEPGITEIPSYTFEYCEYAKTVTLPETVTYLALNAFNDCGSLNNLLLPASLTTIDGSSNTGYPAFIRCESLTDVYYLGTAEEWAAIPKANRVTSANSVMTKHFLQQYAEAPTCTQPGLEPHYRFDNVSVYPVMYDANRQVIEKPVSIPALGHSFTDYVSDGNATCLEDGTETAKCDRCEVTDTQADEGSKLGHSFTDYSSNEDATTEADGTKTAKCDRCDATDTVTDPGSKIPLENAWRREGNKLTLLMDIASDIPFSQDTILDLNGFTITGTVTAADGCTLYCLDSQTDDYTVNDGFGYGKLKQIVGNVVGLPEDPIAGQDSYLMITEEDGISFHRVSLQVTHMVLRPRSAGIYFKSAFAGDELVAQKVDSFGIALNASEAPDTGNMDVTSLYTRFDSSQFRAGTNVTGVLLEQIMDAAKDPAANRVNAARRIYGRTYIRLSDGSYLFGSTVQRSLREQLELADTMWSQLTPVQQTGLVEMYRQFTSVMSRWNIPAIIAAAKKD